MSELDTLADAIQKLSPDDRKQLDAKLAYSKRGQSTALSRLEQYLYDAISEITHRRIPVAEMLNHKLRPAAAELEQYLAASIEKLREPQVQGLVLICVRCLAEYMQGWSKPVPVTPITLLRHMGNLPSAVEQAFPGYHSANLLYWLVAAADKAAQAA